MLGKHRFRELAATLAIGFGTLFLLGASASAAESPVAADLPFQFTVPADEIHGEATALSAFHDIRNRPRHRADGQRHAGDESVVVLTFANILAGPVYFPSHGKAGELGPEISIDIASIPIPSTVWLFLAALALLFGISRRRNTAGY